MCPAQNARVGKERGRSEGGMGNEGASVRKQMEIDRNVGEVNVSRRRRGNVSSRVETTD